MTDWAAMTPREKDAFLAEHVTDWRPHTECDGEIGELPISPDGFFCLKCGYTDSWGNDTAHDEEPKHYTTDIAAAMGLLASWKGDLDICRQNGRWRVELFLPSMEWQAWNAELTAAICEVLYKAYTDDRVAVYLACKEK